MKIEAQKIVPGNRVRIDGLRNSHGEDISCKFWTVREVRVRSISTVLVFDPSEDGPPEIVILRKSEPVVVHRSSLAPAASVPLEADLEVEADELPEPGFAFTLASELRPGDRIVWTRIASGPVVVTVLALEVLTSLGIHTVKVFNTVGGCGLFSADSIVEREV
jgi:hypothetical protein